MNKEVISEGTKKVVDVVKSGKLGSTGQTVVGIGVTALAGAGVAMAVVKVKKHFEEKKGDETEQKPSKISEVKDAMKSKIEVAKEGTKKKFKTKKNNDVAAEEDSSEKSDK